MAQIDTDAYKQAGNRDYSSKPDTKSSKESHDDLQKQAKDNDVKHENLSKKEHGKVASATVGGIAAGAAAGAAVGGAGGALSGGGIFSPITGAIGATGGAVVGAVTGGIHGHNATKHDLQKAHYDQDKAKEKQDRKLDKKDEEIKKLKKENKELKAEHKHKDHHEKKDKKEKVHDDQTKITQPNKSEAQTQGQTVVRRHAQYQEQFGDENLGANQGYTGNNRSSSTPLTSGYSTNASEPSSNTQPLYTTYSSTYDSPSTDDTGGSSYDSGYSSSHSGSNTGSAPSTSVPQNSYVQPDSVKSSVYSFDHRVEQGANQRQTQGQSNLSNASQVSNDYQHTQGGQNTASAVTHDQISYLQGQVGPQQQSQAQTQATNNGPQM